MIQLGCCTGVPIDEKSRQRILQIRAAGFDYVEYGVQACAALTPEVRAEAVRFTKEQGLPCRAMNCFIPKTIPLVGSEADLGKAKRFLDNAFPAVSEFGAQTIVFGSGDARRTPPGFPNELAHIQLIEFLRHLETYCEDYDIKIAIEPLCKAECNTINTVMQGYRLASDVNRPHIRAHADYYHMARNGENLLDIVSAGRLLQHMHLANCLDRGFPREDTREEHRKLFSILKAAKYDRTVSIEGSTPDFEKDIMTSGQILRELRKEIFE